MAKRSYLHWAALEYGSYRSMLNPCWDRADFRISAQFDDTVGMMQRSAIDIIDLRTQQTVADRAADPANIVCTQCIRQLAQTFTLGPCSIGQLSEQW